MQIVGCTACTTAQENPPVNGAQPDMPIGWSTIMIAERGQVVRNFMLCARCTVAVRETMSRLNARHRDSVTVGRHAAVNA